MNSLFAIILAVIICAILELLFRGCKLLSNKAKRKKFEKAVLEIAPATSHKTNF